MLNIVEVPQRHTKHIGLVVSPNDATTAILIGGGCEDETVPFSLFLAPLRGMQPVACQSNLIGTGRLAATKQLITLLRISVKQYRENSSSASLETAH